MSSESFAKMMRRAFTWHWHLLALGGGVVLGILSGKPDVALPVVAALELGYLGFIGTNQRFQKVLQAQALAKAEAGGPPPLPKESRLNRLLSQLTDKDIQRFQVLRNRCTDLIKLRQRIESSDPNYSGGSTFQTDSLDKLLWLFLKLLHQKNALAQFTNTTERSDLVEEAEETREEIEEVHQGSKNPRLIRSLEEKLATVESRLVNYDQSEENLRIVEVELDKTEQKISHIVELGMTTTDGTDLSAQIEALTMSIESNEAAMQDLNLHSLFEEEPDEPRPVLLDLDEVSMASYVELE
ncbi:MAG: hypothetical protein ACI9TH_001026 [Kiritimatiellia bacterium]|jgi:hypothetical protein